MSQSAPGADLYEDQSFAATLTYTTGGVTATVTKASQIVPGTAQVAALASGVTLEVVQNSENGGTAGTVPGQIKIQAFVVSGAAASVAGTVAQVEMPSGSTLIGGVKYRLSYYGT